MSFWYSIYYDLSTSAFWKITEQSKILGTFSDIFSRWLPTSFFHRFWADLDSILGCFLLFKSEKMDTKKDSKNIPAKKSCAKFSKSGPGSCGPWKQFKDSQIPGLLNLTKALETLHWCLAARWRIRATRNLKMKARGDQISNKANPQKIAHMTQKISNKSSKINKKSMEIKT